MGQESPGVFPCIFIRFYLHGGGPSPSESDSSDARSGLLCELALRDVVRVGLSRRGRSGQEITWLV